MARQHAALDDTGDRVDGGARGRSLEAPDAGPATDPLPRPQWRRPLIAAAVTVALTALALALGYERMQDEAEREAAAAAAPSVKQAAASSPADGRDAQRPGPAAPPAEEQSP